MSEPRAYTSIPDPIPTIEGVVATLTAVKETLEVLTGTSGQRGWANQVFIVKPRDQSEVPVGTKTGDLWIVPPVLPTDTWSLSVWREGRWDLIVLP